MQPKTAEHYSIVSTTYVLVIP